MANTFHLAIPAGDLNKATQFYCEILGCTLGNSQEGLWVDVNFWGNELTLHQSDEKLKSERHHVDMGEVCVPHFGVHLSDKDFQLIKQRVIAANVTFVDPPYRRFVDSSFEQETFFIRDPNGNVLEIKTMLQPEVLFESEPC